VAVNPAGTPQPAVYDFGAWTIGAVRTFATTADLDLAGATPPAILPHRFSAALPPRSVTTFVGELQR